MVSTEDPVMLVEDDPDARTYMAQLLRLEGYEVISFPNGAEALKYLENAPPPRLAILDIRMPVMDGIQLRAAMMREPRLARIPVIVVTAFEPPAAANLAALRVFRKPVDFRALINVIWDNC